MKRHESRNIRRSRVKIQKLNPCGRYAKSSGVNPFSVKKYSVKERRPPNNKNYRNKV